MSVSTETADQQRSAIGRVLMVVALVLVFCLGVALAFTNTEHVTVDLLVAEFSGPLIFWMVIELLIVVVIMLAVSALRVARLKRQIKRQSRQIKDQEAELKNLRNLPIHDV